ncbi:MAG: porin, partial [Gammaproteobacteria bacterium]|nr:porin [Gammaproteobacteria bacterium]
PILVALGYVDYNADSVKDAADAGALPNPPFPAGITGASIDDASAWRIGGSYAFGDFKVLASYVDYDSDSFVKDNDPSVWTVGGSYKMGNNTIKLQYSDRDESGLNACDGAGGGVGSGVLSCDDGSDQWSIGLDHAMSKRTTVYAAYATVDNDDDSARKSWGGTNSGHDGEGNAVRGEDADVFSVGIIHKF